MTKTKVKKEIEKIFTKKKGFITVEDKKTGYTTLVIEKEDIAKLLRLIKKEVMRNGNNNK